ncbi:hypothetical protein JCM21738_5544 [Mesobacillus boroniphilus JCM 21738]|uniref:Uncharacterized protein n=1 Tax=Mesobacillus boroniphilus JCM 21738 TaxID=1294265 RepID=W4RVL3_9BACI|nr:hypothetical protein JCM21738_5544 [Mesobacillus boroniphilus JCM 21738]
MRNGFGQIWWTSLKSSQKKSQLQTGLGKEQEKLSEPSATSDRFRGKEEKAVRGKSAKSCQK